MKLLCTTTALLLSISGMSQYAETLDLFYQSPGIVNPALFGLDDTSSVTERPAYIRPELCIQAPHWQSPDTRRHHGEVPLCGAFLPDRDTFNTPPTFSANVPLPVPGHYTDRALLADLGLAYQYEGFTIGLSRHAVVSHFFTDRQGYTPYSFTKLCLFSSYSLALDSNVMLTPAASIVRDEWGMNIHYQVLCTFSGRYEVGGSVYLEDTLVPHLTAGVQLGRYKAAFSCMRVDGLIYGGSQVWQGMLRMNL